MSTINISNVPVSALHPNPKSSVPDSAGRLKPITASFANASCYILVLLIRLPEYQSPTESSVVVFNECSIVFFVCYVVAYWAYIVYCRSEHLLSIETCIVNTACTGLN